MQDVILQGDALAVLRGLPSGIAHCCVTSPPYWNLRDYGVPGQIGLEATVEEYLAKMVEVFSEVRRVLRPDGTLWLNLGDAYANDGKWGGATSGKHAEGLHGETSIGRSKRRTGLPPKSLIGLPWRVAFALQEDGWLLRSDIIWAKENTMPESVRDRPTRAHEYIFLMAKSERYYYDAAAIREPVTGGAHPRKPGRNSRKFVDRDPAHIKVPSGWDTEQGSHGTIHRDGRRKTPGVTPKSAAPGSRIKANQSFHVSTTELVVSRNKRTVWAIASEPYSGAHFATFPTRLVEPCILAGCPSGGLVLDPFFGSGTVGVVALRHSRHYLGVELNRAYIAMAEERLSAGIQRVLWTA